MKALLVIILLVLIGFGAYWFLVGTETRTDLQQMSEDVAERAEDVGASFRERLSELSLSAEDIERELKESGRVVRRKTEAAGEAIAEATADATITAKIKTKLAADDDLSALAISVDTTDGIVTLSGSAESHEAVGKATLLALETDGVREVVSTLQVRRSRDAAEE